MTNQQAAVALPLATAALWLAFNVGWRPVAALLLAVGELIRALLQFAWAMVIVAKDIALVQIIVVCVRLMSEGGLADFMRAAHESAGEGEA